MQDSDGIVHQNGKPVRKSMDGHTEGTTGQDGRATDGASRIWGSLSNTDHKCVPKMTFACLKLSPPYFSAVFIDTSPRQRRWAISQSTRAGGVLILSLNTRLSFFIKYDLWLLKILPHIFAPSQSHDHSPVSWPSTLASNWSLVLHQPEWWLWNPSHYITQKSDASLLPTG